MSTRADERKAALLELVARNPESSEPKVVYADHAHENGDSHGELIALQLSGRRSAREQDLREEVEAQIRPVKSRYGSRYEWSDGFVTSSGVSIDTDLAHPAMRVVNSMTVSCRSGWLEHLCRGRIPVLEALELWFSRVEFEPGALKRLATRFPKLRHLGISGNEIGPDIDFAPFDQLDSIGVDAKSFTNEFLQQFFDTDLSSLRCLELSGQSGAIAQLDRVLGRLLSGRDLPGLEELGLKRFEQSADLLRRVARSPLASQLRRLRFEPGSDYHDTTVAEAMDQCSKELSHLTLIPYPGDKDSTETLAMLNSRYLDRHREALQLLDEGGRSTKHTEERGAILRRLGREADACFADAAQALHFTDGHLEAVGLARRGLELEPNSVYGLGLLARAVALSGDSKVALELCNRALATDPEAREARVCRYWVHRGHGQWNDMIEDLDHLLTDEQPNEDLFSAHKSDGHFCNGDLEAARMALDEGLSRDRDDTFLLHRLLWLHVLATPTRELEEKVSPLLERIEKASRWSSFQDNDLSFLMFLIRTRDPRALRKFSYYDRGRDLEFEIARATARCQQNSREAVRNGLTDRHLARELARRPAELAESEMLLALVSTQKQRAHRLAYFLGDEIDPESLLRAFARAHPKRPRLRTFSVNRFPNSLRDALGCSALSILASVLSEQFDQAQARLDALIETRERYRLFPSTRTIRPLLEVGAIKVRGKRGKELVKQVAQLLYEPFGDR